MYGSVGSGTLPHVAGEMFKAATGVNLMHVPYKGGEGSGSADLVTGRIHLTFNQLPQFLPYVEAGRLKVLAVAGPKRLPQLPGVPTTTEAGLPQFQIVSWFGLVAPSGTPAAVIGRLNAEVQKASETRELKETLAARGAEAASSSPEELGALIAGGTAMCSGVIRTAGIKLD
jgi:tripartite-type tricarboxylate transporter receptor subunit TctC